MSKLYVRVMTGFYTHRKTARLRAAFGDDAFWIPPKLWAYCAENQPDGDLSGYSSPELAELVGCPKYASSMLQALLQAGYLDADGRVHDWAEHNSYHETYAKRAKAAAKARWSKEKPPKPPKEGGETGNRTLDSGDKHCLTHACSILEILKLRLCSMYNRPKTDPWSYEEERCLAETSRRPNPVSEMGEVESFKTKRPTHPAFPGSIVKLLTEWQPTLDRARTYEPPIANGHPKPNPRNIGIGITPADQTKAILATIARRKAENAK